MHTRIPPIHKFEQKLGGAGIQETIPYARNLVKSRVVPLYMERRYTWNLTVLKPKKEASFGEAERTHKWAQKKAPDSEIQKVSIWSWLQAFHNTAQSAVERNRFTLPQTKQWSLKVAGNFCCSSTLVVNCARWKLCATITWIKRQVKLPNVAGNFPLTLPRLRGSLDNKIVTLPAAYAFKRRLKALPTHYFKGGNFRLNFAGVPFPLVRKMLLVFLILFF